MSYVLKLKVKDVSLGRRTISHIQNLTSQARKLLFLVDIYDKKCEVNRQNPTPHTFNLTPKKATS
jgi:hypothetical protein